MDASSPMPALARKLINYVVLTWIALIFIFPIVFMVVSSFKPDLQLLRDSASINAFLPVGDISFDNYRAAFQRVPITHFIINSVMVTGITMLLSLLVCSMAGFAFVFLDFPGRAVMLAVVLATFIVPFESIAIPLLLVVNPGFSNREIHVVLAGTKLKGKLKPFARFQRPSNHSR